MVLTYQLWWKLTLWTFKLIGEPNLHCQCAPKFPFLMIIPNPLHAGAQRCVTTYRVQIEYWVNLLTSKKCTLGIWEIWFLKKRNMIKDSVKYMSWWWWADMQSRRQAAMYRGSDPPVTSSSAPFRPTGQPSLVYHSSSALLSCHRATQPLPILS